MINKTEKTFYNLPKKGNVINKQASINRLYLYKNCDNLILLLLGYEISGPIALTTLIWNCQ